MPSADAPRGTSGSTRPRAFEAGDRSPVDATAYREHFKQRGAVTLFSPEAFDSRRIASWAPYLVVPTAFFITNRAPKQHRVRVWAGCLGVFAFCSAIMYNTDTSADGDGPAIIHVR